MPETPFHIRARRARLFPAAAHIELDMRLPCLQGLGARPMVHVMSETEHPLMQAPFIPGGTFGLDTHVYESLLSEALSRGGDYADLFFEYVTSGSISFEEGITRAASKGVSMGLGVRVCRGDATGYAHTEDLSPESMRRAARTAAKIAQAGVHQHPLELRAVTTPKRYDLNEVSLDRAGMDKRALLERASKAALALDHRILKSEASFSEELREILVVTSDGRYVLDSRPLLRFGVRVVAESQGRRESGHSGGGGRVSLGYFDSKAPEWHAQKAVNQALTMLDARSAPAGQFEVVLAPGDSGILLHEAVGHGLEADFNRKRTSNYTDCIGKVVASPLCTVVDDASLIQGRGSINVDDEGQIPGKTVLIENGVLQGYLHDRLSSRHFNVAPSGNGRRENFTCHPMPRMTNTLLLAGPHDPEEIVKSVKRGVYAKTFGGGQVDISNGDFVFSLTESYLIEDGQLTSPLKGVNLIGNGPETLREVTMLGNDVQVSDGIWTCGKDGQSVPVGVGCPTTKISRITVGGTRID
jgi:TldD protein